jgi:hypothetical protein
MLPAVLEKASFVVAVAALFLQGRVAALMLGFAGVDLLFGALFVLAYVRTGKEDHN